MFAIKTFVVEADLLDAQDISRLRRLLEPLSVVYERYVATADRDPGETLFELRELRQKSGQEAGEKASQHIFSGEALKAVNECWQALREQEYRQHIRNIESRSCPKLLEL